MFKRILVPVDLTPKNKRAVRMAAQMASTNRCEVTLLHVIELVQGIPMDELKTFYRKLENEARKGMKLLMASLAKSGIEVRGEIVYGNRVNEIIRHAVSHRVDLIVLGSHRVSLKKAGQEWGTISHKVSILSQCPVLLVK
jgi:universal stress protein A